MVGDAYQVAGRTFVPKQNPEGYSATGLASWYGDAFHGRLTANGEVYDVNGISAAHPTLPLPSYVRVSNLENGRSMIVRVNDRGPFARGRLIDVSERVADMLDFHNNGTAQVRVDYMGPARMDGLDEQTLLASYRAPNGGGDTGVRYAWNKPAAKPRTQPQVMLASAPQMPRLGPAVIQPAVNAGRRPSSCPLTPNRGRQTTAATTCWAADPANWLRQFIRRAAKAECRRCAPRKKWPTGRTSKTALAAAAQRRANELGLRNTPTIVRLGVFGNAANADRVARDFSRYGAISKSPSDTGGKNADGRQHRAGPVSRSRHRHCRGKRGRAARREGHRQLAAG